MNDKAFCFIVTITVAVYAKPVSINPTMSLGQNIQPIVCKSEAGDKGICMFAVDCIKMNGVSLGACVHLFYFGSCCALRSSPTTTPSAHFIGSVPGNSSSPLLTLTTTTPSTNFTSSSLITQTTDSVCGRPLYKYPVPRVVNGSPAKFGQWPWQISLRQWNSWAFLHSCGGTLLNQNWAITAAHCVENVQPDNLLLRMGQYDLTSANEIFPYVDRKVQIIVLHPKYNSILLEYDLALLRFNDPVQFQPNIIPICLPPSNPLDDYVGRMAYVTGWGRLYEDGPMSVRLQQVSVPVMNNTECEKMFLTSRLIQHISSMFICAGYPEGKRDSCDGDSGGPMVIHDNIMDRWALAGVISWGIGCAEANRPGVYTRISLFREWIEKIISI